MDLLEFRITNFRSIVDTGWCPFSADQVTVLIGQNESGKTSILKALEKTFDQKLIDDDDIRANGLLPTVFVRVKTSADELEEQLGAHTDAQKAALDKYLVRNKGVVELLTRWVRAPQNDKEAKFLVERTVEDPTLAQALEKAWDWSDKNKRTEGNPTENFEAENGEEDDNKIENAEVPPLTPEAVGEAIFQTAPLSIYFDEKTGLLPDQIDVSLSNGTYVLSGDGDEAAENYLELAGIDLATLMSGDARTRESILHRGNQKVTKDFASFWSQTIGKSDKLYLKCSLGFYGSNTGKSGRPHLTFLISDGQNHLYPKQRSTGVRWFLSFYLQLKSSDAHLPGSIFLLDEPGANLHEKAQGDVLKLINELGSRKRIVYSTHSPHMIEYDKLYRVLAVEREGEQDDTPTIVKHAHQLGGASRDTLSPLITSMGADLSRQDVIKKNNNVILEEMSAFYYLRTFWKLSGETTNAYFIAATGANNVELLANMFMGWGLGFMVAVDDDATGRGVFNNLKRNMYGDDEETANSRLLKISVKGIEDIFSAADFKTYILEDEDASYTCSNSQHVKDGRFSKAVLAYKFAIKVSNENFKLKKLSGETQTKIYELISEIKKRLN